MWSNSCCAARQLSLPVLTNSRLLFYSKRSSRFNHLDFMHGKWPTSVVVVNLLLIDSSLLELFYINKLATHSWPSCLGKQKRNDFQINIPTKFKFVAKGLKFMLFKIQMVCIHIPEKNISLHNQWVSHQGERGGGHKAWEKKQNSTHLNIQMYNVTVVNVINCFHNLLYKAHCFIFRQVVLFNQELK